MIWYDGVSGPPAWHRQALPLSPLLCKTVRMDACRQGELATKEVLIREEEEYRKTAWPYRLLHLSLVLQPSLWVARLLHLGWVEEDGQGGEESQGPDHGVAPHLGVGWSWWGGGGSGTCRPRIVSRELRCSGKSTRSLNAEDCMALKVEVSKKPGSCFLPKA